MSRYHGEVRRGASLAVLLVSCGASDRVFVVPPPPVEGIQSQVVMVETEIDQKVLAFSSGADQRLVTDIPLGQSTRIETFAYTRPLSQLSLTEGRLTPASSGAQADSLPATEHRFLLQTDGRDDQLSWIGLGSAESVLAKFRLQDREAGCVRFWVDTHPLETPQIGFAVRVGERAVLVSTRTPRFLLVRPGEAPVAMTTNATVTFTRAHRDAADRVWAVDVSGHVYRLRVDALTFTATRLFRAGDPSKVIELAVDDAEDPNFYTLHASGAVLQHRAGVTTPRHDFGSVHGNYGALAIASSGDVLAGHSQSADLAVIGPDTVRLFKSPSRSVSALLVHSQLGTIVGTFTGELLAFDGEAFERLGSERFAAGVWSLAEFGPRVVYSGPIVKAVGQYSTVEYCELQFLLSSGGQRLVPIGDDVVVVLGRDTQRRGFVSVLTVR